MLSHKIDRNEIRKDFPIFKNSPRLYLDNAAMSQKPQCVIDCVSYYYTHLCANVHRGIDTQSQEVSAEFEKTRGLVQKFIGAKFSEEILFTRGTTESLNLVALCWGKKHVCEGDIIIVSEMEHHANLIPWLLLAKEKGAHIKVIPLNDKGELDWQVFKETMNERVRVVALSYVSNVLGTINPVKQYISLAHKYGAIVCLDCAQAMLHFPIDVCELGADFIAFSGYKMLAPSGIGVLYGREEHLNKMPAFFGGGNMVKQVTFDNLELHPIPRKFEAGTPPIEGVLGLGKAIEYLQSLPHSVFWEEEQKQALKIQKMLVELPMVRLIGESSCRVPIFSLYMEGVHPHDLGTFLDSQGISVRVGHHCAQPIMRKYQVPATLRASFALYNTEQEANYLIECLLQAKEFFHGATKCIV